MKIIFYVFLAGCFCLSACKEEKGEKVISKADILTGGNQKGWKYTVVGEQSGCIDRETIHNDNTYTFYTDKKLIFDNGTITETADGQCGDLANLEGTWTFSSNEDSLSFYATRRLDNNRDLKGEKFITGRVVSISVDKIELNYMELSVIFTPR